MKEIHFSNWKEALERSGLAERRKRSFKICIRWYLSFCRRGRAGVMVESARDFVEWAVSEKKPEPWQIEEWKEGLNWFFREARPGGKDGGRGWRRNGRSLAGAPEEAEGPAWKASFLTAVRRRRYSYRTEQSYLVWIERFARQVQREDLEVIFFGVGLKQGFESQVLANLVNGKAWP